MKKITSRTRSAKVADRDCNYACSAKVSKKARVAFGKSGEV